MWYSATMVRQLAVVSLLVIGCGQKAAPAPAADGSLTTPYLAIGDVLANDKLDNLAELGAQVVQAAEGAKDQPGVDRIVTSAGRVAAQDIATARKAFEGMSMAMIDYLVANPDKRAGLTLVHCTMTFEGKGGYWVQREGEVMNPYEGAMMLHCGDKKTWDEAPKS